MLAYVGKEGRGRETAPENHRGAGDQGWEQVGHQGVAMEKGHAAVQDVVGAEGPRRVGRRPRRPTLGHAHRLGGSGRPRREEHQVEGIRARHFVDGKRRRSAGGQQLPVLRSVDCQDPGGAEVEISQQRRLGGVGEDQLAVGVPDVVRQRSSPPSRIDADHGGAGEGGPEEHEDVLGQVLQQHADVEWSVTPQFLERSGAAGGFGHDLRPRPGVPLEQEAGTVVGGSVHHMRGDGERCRPGRVAAVLHEVSLGLTPPSPSRDWRALAGYDRQS